MTSRVIILFLLIVFGLPQVHAQNNGHMYRYNWKRDAPITFGAMALTGMAYLLMPNKGAPSESTILALDANNVNSFDRSAIKHFSERSKKASDVFLLSSFAYSGLLFVNKDVRKDWWQVLLLYLETISFTTAAYSNVVLLTSRLRPYAYNPDVPMGFKTRYHTKNSFYAGHPSITAASTFFVAQVFADFYPCSPWKYPAYAGAAVFSITNAYLRYRAGRHFPSDLILGVGISSLIGFGIPLLYKHRDKGCKVSLKPFGGEYSGLRLNYTFPSRQTYPAWQFKGGKASRITLLR